MNIDYKLGNVIASETSFNDYKFPNPLPTEEWAGDEVRSYNNYIRPVANLFENDRENQNFSKEIIDSLIYKTNKDAIVDGCEIAKTSAGGNNYYEIKEGIFINEGKVYHIFPACEAVAKQIKKEFILEAGIDLDIKIWYDDAKKIYYYNYISEDATKSSSGQLTKAAELVYVILNGLSLTNYNVEDHIILPIFKNVADDSYFYFNDTAISVGTPTSTSTILGKLVSSVINYDDVIPFTIDANHFQKDTLWFEIGNTRFNLQDTKTEVSGVNYINDVKLETDANKLKISDKSSHAITTAHDYTLGTACEKDFSTSATLDENAKLPTAAAIKTYVENTINGQNRTSLIDFNNGINVTNGGATIAGGETITSGGATITGDVTANNKLLVKDTSATSFETKGGIKANGDIISVTGNIVGINSGTYSLRKFKENISDFEENAVDLINGVKIVNYNYISDPEKNHKVGFIADDTHEYFATKNHDIMDQSNCIGLLLKAVQELSAENIKLKEEIDAIRHKIDA